MKQSLISNAEILRLTPLDNTTKDHQLKPHRNLRKLFNTWLTLDLYDILIGDLKDYEAVEYNKATVYVVGAYAVECGQIYEMIDVAGNGVIDLYSDCGVNWKIADRFQDACLNGLYPELQDWLAWQIGSDATPFLHVKTGGGGHTTSGTDKRGNQGADEKMVRMSNSAWKKAAQSSLDMLRKSISKLESSDDCDILSEATTECGGVTEKNNNRTSGYGIEY